MASGGSWLNQDFGGDDEESDNDFNPGLEGASDAEDDGDQATKSNTAARRADERYDEGGDASTRAPTDTKSASPVRRDGRPAPDDDEDEDDQDEPADNGEDDEGEGE